jgi:hypothetical protein
MGKCWVDGNIITNNFIRFTRKPCDQVRHKHVRVWKVLELNTTRTLFLRIIYSKHYLIKNTFSVNPDSMAGQCSFSQNRLMHLTGNGLGWPTDHSGIICQVCVHEYTIRTSTCSEKGSVLVFFCLPFSIGLLKQSWQVVFTVELHCLFHLI